MEEYKWKLNIILDELEQKLQILDPIKKDFTCSPLAPCSYYHEGPCLPNKRTCYGCWRYWCGKCGSGLGGMYGKCSYKRCKM